MKYYVDCKASVNGDGKIESPFKTIQQAADIAQPGDEVLVYPGIYHENVDPKNAGKENARIVYRSLEPRKAVITGAETVREWKSLGDGVWTAEVDNKIFGDYNPYSTRISGDWFMAAFVAHTGDIFLNGKSMYEATELEQVKHPEIFKASWDKKFSLYKWYAEVSAEKTIFFANLGKLDPNEQNIEISVRPNCFYPQKEGVGYITLSGFTVCKAATQWAPPTAYQEGMIGPHWSKGWIIEDCDVFESKCSGISLGKYKQENNDNKWSKWKYKDGTQTERDCICQAQNEGWTKSKIGSHIIRHCEIHDCGQTGIVGHLGGVFSIIEDNHIYNINNKQNLAGAEIGGIKMHAAIDVIFRRNVIHHCTRGIWLDWQAQGTRVTQNLFFDNTLPDFDPDGKLGLEFFQAFGEDVFIEVSHGPTLLDNNIFLSSRAVKIAAQGVSLVHNIVGGSLAAIGTGTDNGSIEKPSPRFTPYHVPHNTEVAGFMTILHGDVKFYNNVFVQQDVKPIMRIAEKVMSSDGNKWDDGCVSAGTMRYNGYPTFDEWKQMFEGYCGMGSAASDRYYEHLPVWAAGNMYFNGAEAWEKEEQPIIDTEHKIYFNVVNENGKYRVETNLQDYVGNRCEDSNSLVPTAAGQQFCELVTTETLGMAFEPEQKYENPDGTPIVFDTDYYGNKRKGMVKAGAFA